MPAVPTLQPGTPAGLVIIATKDSGALANTSSNPSVVSLPATTPTDKNGFTMAIMTAGQATGSAIITSSVSALTVTAVVEVGGRIG